MSDKLIVTDAGAECKVPVDSESFGSETRRLYDFLTSRVIGQERAIKRIARGFSIANAGLKPANKPIFSGILSGPTGVGKTLIGKAVSWFLIEDRPIAPATIIDCTNLTEHHQTSQLIGSPAGYVGYNDEPVLSQDNLDKHDRNIKWNEWCRKHGVGRTKEEREKAWERFLAANKAFRSVVIFDEFEKAHRQIQFLMMAIIDEARLSMAKGGDVTYFSNSVVLLTCNVGARRIQEMLSGKSKSMGFSREAMAQVSPEEMDEMVYRETERTIRDKFPPEFVGRVRDQIIVFRSLTREQATLVQELELDKVRLMVSSGDRFKHRPIRLIFQDDFREFLLDEGYSIEFGCRPIEQAVKRFVTLPLSNSLDNGSVQPGDTVLFSLDGKKPKLTRKARPVPVLPKLTPRKPPIVTPPPKPLPAAGGKSVDDGWDDCFKPVNPDGEPADDGTDDEPDDGKPNGGSKP
jgi:ATP-dependent Clp protease ATP-binding subunit ClpA